MRQHDSAATLRYRPSEPSSLDASGGKRVEERL